MPTQGDSWWNSVLRSVPEALFVLDGSGRVVFANPGAERLLDPEDTIVRKGQKPTFTLRYLDGAEVPLSEYPARRALRGETVRRAEYLATGKRGSMRLLVSADAVSDGSYVVVLCTDITGLRTVSERHSDYIGALAHDIRGPLSTLLLQSQVMYMEARSSGLEKQALAAETILRNGGAIDAMLDDAVDLDRIGAGFLRPRRRRVDLCTLLRDIVRRRYDGGAQANQLSLRLPKGPCAVNADPVLLGRCIDNLITNALKHTPTDTQIQIVLVPEGDLVQVTVSDKGPGISAEHLPRIFERFYRIDGTRTEGAGLGLYITKAIAEAHGGALSVSSAQGEGSSFTLSIPAG